MDFEEIRNKFKDRDKEENIDTESVIREAYEYSDSVEKRTRYILEDTEKEKAEELSNLLKKKQRKK